MTAPDKAFEEWAFANGIIAKCDGRYVDSNCAKFARAAWLASRKAMAEEAASLSRDMFNRAADGDEIADAILALIVDNPPAKVVNQQAKG